MSTCFTGIDHLDQYVLKPQREGGGNNLWDQEMKEKLLSLAEDPARAQFILMQKITPPVLKNKFVRRGVMSEELDTVSEVGFDIFSHFIQNYSFSFRVKTNPLYYHQFL